MQRLITSLHVQYFEKSITLPAIEVRMDNHESAFTFLDVFTECSSFLSIAFRIDSEDIIHDLERGTHHVDEATKGGLRLRVLPCHLTDHSQRHAGQARRLVLDHLVVLGC